MQAGLMNVASSASLGTTFSVVMAAIVHSGIIRKEIKSQLINVTEGITKSIDGVATALKEELNSQGTRIANIENGVNKLSSRVDAIEQKEKK